MTPEVRALLKGRVAAVLNVGSGRCDPTSAGRVQAIFEAAGLSDFEIDAVEPAEIEAALDRAAAQADVLVVLGGDGTIRTAAMKCGQAGIPLAPLPGGTMNMLPHALYGDCEWEQALADTLADPEIRDVSGGDAGGEPFYCAAILGAPTLWADARESFREGRLVETVQRSVTAARRAGSDALSYRLGATATGTAEAVAVICPLVSRALTEDERGLEAAALDPATAADVLRLAMRALFDDWRNDPSVQLAKVREIKVTAHGRVPVILDGERVRLGRTVRIAFIPKAFRALAPAQPATPPA